jgi:hypothetical protein
MVVKDGSTEGTEKRRYRFDSSSLDRKSYNLGMIYAFSEVVGSGCKRLALSPALTNQEFRDIVEDVQTIVEEYDLVLKVEDDFLATRLFNPDYTRDRLVILIAAEQATIDEYMALKGLKREHIEARNLTECVEVEIAWDLGRLLSYSDETIEGLLERQRF